jgi:hypothetical protein
MAYRVHGLDPAPFEALFHMDDAALERRRAVRVSADGPGYPCRVSLQEAAVGDALILVHHVSHDVETPFRTGHAIYVREGAQAAVAPADEVPEVIDRRQVSLRAFGADGMMKDGLVAAPGQSDAAIRQLFDRDDVAVIHAHTAAYGCYLARIERN